MVRHPIRSLLALLVLLGAVGCSDDGGGNSSLPDPNDCNNSLHIVKMDDRGGVNGQFGAQDVVASLGDETLVLALSGYKLGGEIPEDASGVPEQTNLFVAELSAPDGGFDEGQSFTDGDEPADGELVVRTLVRGTEDLEADPLTITLGPIDDATVCGAIWTEGGGVDGTFKAERRD